MIIEFKDFPGKISRIQFDISFDGETGPQTSRVLHVPQAPDLGPVPTEEQRKDRPIPEEMLNLEF